MKVKNKRIKLIFLFLFLFLMVSGAFFVKYSWNKSIQDVSERAFLISETAAIGLDGEMIKQLNALPDDYNSGAYKSIKKRLSEYLSKDSKCNHAYLYTIHNDRVYYMVHSIPTGSEDYIYPGTENKTAGEEFRIPFKTKESHIAGAVDRKEGECISVLTPIIKEQTGEVFATFGMDYSAKVWSQEATSATRLAGIIVFGALFLLVLFYLILIDVAKKRRAENALRKKTEELDHYFSSSLDLLCITDTKGRFVRLNPEWKKVLGYELFELEGEEFIKFVHPDDIEETLSILSRSGEKKEDILNFMNRYRCKDGSYRWIEWKSRTRGDRIYAVARDVTEKQELEEELKNRSKELEKRVVELEKFHQLTMGREKKMIELKERIKELEEGLGKCQADEETIKLKERIKELEDRIVKCRAEESSQGDEC